LPIKTSTPPNTSTACDNPRPQSSNELSPAEVCRRRYTTSASADELFVHESKLAVAARLAAERLALGAHSQAAAFANAARRMRQAGVELGEYHKVLNDLESALLHLDGCCSASLDAETGANGPGTAPKPAETPALEIDEDFAKVLDKIDSALRDEDAEEAAGLACRAQKHKRPASGLLSGRIAAVEALVQRADFGGASDACCGPDAVPHALWRRQRAPALWVHAHAALVRRRHERQLL
jgi:hypothetical protein